MKTYLGIDVGSISYKFVLIDEENQILFRLYKRTEGNPILAIQNGFRELKKFIDSHDSEIEIVGVATTGSARYLAGVIAGADLVKNEITAHAKAVSHFVPDAQTVIEIGGQDSKIIILENKVAVDFAMNLICLKGDAEITTNPSCASTLIKEIKIGQKVLTHKGRFRPVEQVFEREYRGEMIKIEVSNIKNLNITPNHQILGLKRKDIKCYQSYSRQNIAICKPTSPEICKKRCSKWKNFSWEPKFIPAGELREGDFVATPIPLKNEMDNPALIDYSVVKTEPKILRPFKLIDKFVFEPDLLRLLGYYLAEGCILYNRARWNKQVKYPCGVSFVFNIKEQNYINDIKNIISKNFKEINVTIEKKPEHNSSIVSIYSKALTEYIKYLCGSMANKKRLSPELLNLDPSLQKEIVKGFFRGDGHLQERSKNASGINKKGNRYCACTISSHLAHQIYWLLLRNKIKCTFRKNRKKTKGRKNAYFIEIFGEEINKLEDKKVIKVKKKGDKSFIYSNWLLQPIKKIEKYNYKGKVYNLEVKEDHSYISNLISVKNCSAGTGAFLDAQAYRLGVPIEKFGELTLASKNPTTIGSRCSVFAESDMIHKQQIGHKVEDIIAGLCQGLARNYLSGVAKGKKIKPPIIFLGGVSENVGMRWAFEKALEQKINVPSYNTVMGALGAALLIKEVASPKTKFRGFEISEKDIRCTSFQCRGCPNQCEVIEARIEEKIVARWGDRCAKWSNLNPI